MGFLNLFSKSENTRLLRLPSGSFTLDRQGRLMSSTLPQAFPESCIREIGEHVLSAFRSAKAAQMPFTEIVVHFAALKLMARELAGGAIVFLMPKSFSSSPRKQNSSYE